MAKKLFDEQKEDLLNLVKNRYTYENIRDYCIENNIPYRQTQDFITETQEYIKNNPVA